MALPAKSVEKIDYKRTERLRFGRATVGACAAFTDLDEKDSDIFSARWASNIWASFENQTQPIRPICFVCPFHSSFFYINKRTS